MGLLAVGLRCRRDADTFRHHCHVELITVVNASIIYLAILIPLRPQIFDSLLLDGLLIFQVKFARGIRNILCCCLGSVLIARFWPRKLREAFDTSQIPIQCALPKPTRRLDPRDCVFTLRMADTTGSPGTNRASRSVTRLTHVARFRQNLWLKGQVLVPSTI